MQGYLLPISALVRRELVTVLRKWWTRWLLVALLVASGILLVSGYLDFNPWTIRAYVAEIQFNVFVGGWMAVAILLLTPLSALSIVDERKRGSFETLRLTPLTPGQILLGKLLNNVGLYLLLLIAVMPVAGVLLFMSGISATRFAMMLGICMISAMTITAMGIAASAWARERMAAIIVAVLAVAWLAGVPQFLAFSIVGQLFPGFVESTLESIAFAWPNLRMHEGMLLLSAVSNLGALGLIMLGGVTEEYFLVSVGTHACYLGFALFIAHRGIRRASYDYQPRSRIARSFETSILMAPVHLYRRGSEAWSLEDGRNPIYWQSLSTTRLPKRSTICSFYLVVAGMIFGLNYLIYDIPYGPRTPEVVLGWCGACAGAAILALPGAIAAFVTRDRDSRCEDLLHTSLLTPREIVMGRFQAGLLAVSPFVVILAFGSLPMLQPPPQYAYSHLNAPYEAANIRMLILGFVSLLACLPVAAAASVCGAMLSRDGRRTVVFSYLIVLAFFFAGSILAQLIREASWHVFRYSPLGMFVPEHRGDLPWIAYFVWALLPTPAFLWAGQLIYRRVQMQEGAPA